MRLYSRKIILISFLIVSTSTGTIIRVPQDKLTIQAGIDVAADGDTVLVDTGRYVENIFINKNITVASLFLITGDTTYVSRTVIDGDSISSVVTFPWMSGSSAILLSGFTIRNGAGTPGWHESHGGGILCFDSSPTLSNLIITENSSNSGGGIDCTQCDLTLVNVTITENRAIIPPWYGWEAGLGGGIYCQWSDLTFVNVIIANNTAAFGGGGIYSDGSDLRFENVTVKQNTAYYYGGGIACVDDSYVTFSTEDRCNIYLNHSGAFGNDIYYGGDSTLGIVVDTFSLLNPSAYITYPLNKYSFDISNAKVEPVNSDLHVNPDGDNANSGQSPSSPLQSISFALLKIIANSDKPHSIHLSNGLYSPRSNEERFPLNMASHVSLLGESMDDVVLDAEGKSHVISFYRDSDVAIENLTVTGGETLGGGGGIRCYDSSPIFRSIKVRNNKASYGGGIFCSQNSRPSLVNVAVTGNVAEVDGGAISLVFSSSPFLINVTMTGNYGGGIFCVDGSKPTLVNTILWDNSPYEVLFNEASEPNAISISHSDVRGGEDGIIMNDNGAVFWEEGNTDADPLFVDPENEDFHLQKGSPCIDAGTAFFVWEGDTLLNLSDTAYEGNAPDMGAFEYGGVSIGTNPRFLPSHFALHHPYPNPFNPSTTIKYDLPRAGHVSLIIYDVLGRQVEVAVDRWQEAGTHSVVWGVINVPSGIYLVRMTSGSFSQVRKVMVLK